MRTRSRHDRGAVIPLVALLLPVLILMTAIAVDLGRQRDARRSAQADADIISLDLVRLADGRTLNDIMSGTNSPLLSDAGTPLDATTALVESAARNGIDASLLTVDWGTFTTSGGFVSTLGNFNSIPNAVEVTAIGSIDYFFQPGQGDVERSAVASSGIEPLAGFSIGSFGASIDPTSAGLLNSLITPLLGNPVGLNALSYQGLAAAQLSIFDLGAELGLLDPDEVLGTEVATEDVLLAAADVLERNGDTANATLLRNSVTAQVQAMSPITLGDIVSADPTGQDAALETDINALDILTTAAFLSQCTPMGTTIDDCSGINIPSLTTTLPLLSNTGSIRVVQSPQYHYGPVGTGTRTNQTRVVLNTNIGAQSVGACVPSLANLFCIVNGLLVGAVDASVSVQAEIELAGGRANIADIDCTDPTALGLDLLTSTSLYELDLTVTVQFGRRGVLGGALGPLLGTLVLHGGTTQNNPSGPVEFTVAPDVFGQTIRSVGGGSAGLSPVSLSVVSGNGVLGTLGTLGITNTVGPLLNSLVNPLLNQIDTQIVTPLTNLLGVNVVGADLTPEAIDCLENEIRLVG